MPKRGIHQVLVFWLSWKCLRSCTDFYCPLHRPLKQQFHFGRPLFFLGVILQKYPKTVQNSCIRKVFVHSLGHTYVVNIHENTLLFHGSQKFCALRWCYEKFWVVYIYLAMETITLHEMFELRTFRKRLVTLLCRNLTRVGCLIGWHLVLL